MATHSSILAGKIPWTEKPDGLQLLTTPQSSDTHRRNPKLQCFDAEMLNLVPREGTP